MSLEYIGRKMRNNTKTIKYVGFYETSGNIAKRHFCLSAANKMDYICKVLVENNHNVEIVSPSSTLKTYGYYKGEYKRISEGVFLKTFATFGSKYKLLRGAKHLYSLLQLCIYLIKSVGKNESVIVYHCELLSFPIRIARFVKGFKLILEVEEIYQDVGEASYFIRKSEDGIIKAADSYILSTELLNEKINFKKKPYAVISGVYKFAKKIAKRQNDGKIHVVYAGTFDPRKGGLVAVAAAEYLTNKYHMHILGLGSKKEIKNMEQLVESVSEKSQSTVTYDGLLSGENYLRFLQKCHIGLSTQMPDASFNETSFPSKILSYMSNGLQVVSIRIRAIENSAIGQFITYYNQQTPQALAAAIMSVDISGSGKNKETLKRLHKDLKSEIQILLK